MLVLWVNTQEKRLKQKVIFSFTFSSCGNSSRRGSILTKTAFRENKNEKVTGDT